MSKIKELVQQTANVMSDKKKGSGRRYNSGKTRMALFPAWAYAKIGEVYTKGADKYTVRDDDGNIIDSGDNNWMNGMDWSIAMNSLERHYNAFKRGKDFDFDPNCADCVKGSCLNHTGAYHMAQVAWNAIALLEFYRVYPQGDNRLKPFLNYPKIGLDIDEVLANWVDAWRDRFDINNVPTSWFFDRQIKERFEEMRASGELDEFYLNLEPRVLSKDLPFVPHCYITSRPVETEVTIQWLDKHGFPARPVYTVPVGTSKVEVAKKAGVEVFVDDSWDNFVDFNKNGITCYLFDQPHNNFADVGHLRIKSLKELPLIQS